MAGAAQGAGAGDGEGHVPEVGVFLDELDADIIFAIAGAAHVDDATLGGVGGVIVDQEKLLAQDDGKLEVEKRAVAIDGLRVRGDREFFAFAGFAVHSERNRQRYPHSASTFPIAEVYECHMCERPSTATYEK